MADIRENQIYQHYKDKTHLYQILAVGRHSETEEEMVVYKALYPNPVSQIWIRPKDFFQL